VALIRFDSFANFLVPKNVRADEIETLNHLIEYVIKGFVFVKKVQLIYLVRLVTNVGYFQRFIEDI